MSEQLVIALLGIMLGWLIETNRQLRKVEKKLSRLDERTEWIIKRLENRP